MINMTHYGNRHRFLDQDYHVMTLIGQPGRVQQIQLAARGIRRQGTTAYSQAMAAACVSYHADKADSVSNKL